MKNFIRSLAAAALLAGLFAGTAFAQEQGQTLIPSSDGIITLTQENQNTCLPNIKGKDILVVASSPEFKRAHLSELKNIAALHNDKLVIILVDPKAVSGVDDLVSTMVAGPVQYPSVLYIGPVLHNLGRWPYARRRHHRDS